MSETDDTDVLLLIPPNFFLVNSSGSEDSLLDSSRTVVHKPVSCTAQVLDKLVNQVHTLESRLESLEISSDISSIGRISKRKTLDTTDSFESHSLDRKAFTFPRRRRRKTQKRESKRDLSLTSLDSASTQKSIPPLKLDKITHYQHTEVVNDTRSMDGDISSIVSTPSKKNDKLLLNEIDEFLTKVESYESPESKLKEHYDSFTPDNIIKAAGDYITQKLDSKDTSQCEDQVKLPSGRIVSSNVLDKYIYLVKGNPPQAEKSVSSNIYKSQYGEPVQSTSKQYNESMEQTLEASRSATKTRQEEIKSPSIRRLSFTENKNVQPTSTPKKTTTTQSYLDTFRPTSNKIYDRATKVLEQYKAQNSRATQSSDSYLSKEEFKMPQMRPYTLDHKDIKMTALQHKMLDSIDTDLLSLSELWGERGERERVERVDSIKLEEERLKREHCEALIQQLQKKLLEQQEKIAVALKVDRAKDSAIARLKEAWVKITSSLDKAEERHRAALDKMCREVENFRIVADDAQKKTNHFEAELYKTLDLAHDYQEKCKQLTAEKKEIQESTERALVAKQEVIDNKEKEVEVLRENYETVMKLNKQATDCVQNLEDALEKEKSDHEQTKQKTNELTQKIQSLSDEMSIVAQERDTLKGKVNEERARGSILEHQLEDKQELASQLLHKCDTLDSEVKSLRKQLEIQKNELKSHYQRQLEEAVMSKLQEFQRQLDASEKDLEVEARSKEAALVEGFGKQIARIEEQHKLEVNVLEEKQREEIKLYRLQLAQAAEKVALLEGKLESYRRRRGQIASQLHSVMESQWRQALLILTSGATDLARVHTASPQACEARPPPLAPAPAAGDAALGSRAALDALSDTEIQHYVKLLLSKPAGLDGGGDSARATDEPTTDRERPREARRSLAKPPWKA